MAELDEAVEVYWKVAEGIYWCLRCDLESPEKASRALNYLAEKFGASKKGKNKVLIGDVLVTRRGSLLLFEKQERKGGKRRARS